MLQCHVKNRHCHGQHKLLFQNKNSSTRSHVKLRNSIDNCPALSQISADKMPVHYFVTWARIIQKTRGQGGNCCIEKIMDAFITNGKFPLNTNKIRLLCKQPRRNKYAPLHAYMVIANLFLMLAANHTFSIRRPSYACIITVFSNISRNIMLTTIC